MIRIKTGIKFTETTKGLRAEMHRGDTVAFTVRMQDDEGVPIPFVPGDKIYFLVTEDPKLTTTLIHKEIDTFPDGKALVNILPADTKPLQFNREYHQTIRAVLSSGLVRTLAYGPFVVLEEVPYE